MQGTEYLAIGHRDTVTAHGIHGVHKQGVAHHAHLDAFEVVRSLDQLFGVQAACAAVHPAQSDQAGRAGCDFFQQFRADGAVNHGAHVRNVAEHKRHVEHIHIRHHGADHAQRNAHDLDGANLGLLDRFFFLAQHGAGEHLHLDAAIGGGFQFLAHAFNGYNGGVAGRVGVGGFEHHVLGLRAQGAAQGKGGNGGCHKSSTESHACLLFRMVRV